MGLKKHLSWIVPISILLSLIGGVFLLGYIARQANKKVESDGIETVCSTYGGGKRIIQIRYKIEGKVYTVGVGMAFNKTYVGEEFYMKYLPDSPESVSVFFDRPFFQVSILILRHIALQ